MRRHRQAGRLNAFVFFFFSHFFTQVHFVCCLPLSLPPQQQQQPPRGREIAKIGESESNSESERIAWRRRRYAANSISRARAFASSRSQAVLTMHFFTQPMADGGGVWLLQLFKISFFILWAVGVVFELEYLLQNFSSQWNFSYLHNFWSLFAILYWKKLNFFIALIVLASIYVRPLSQCVFYWGILKFPTWQFSFFCS